MSDSGFVYALKNESFGAGIYKIGMTRKDPQERAKELSSQTSIPSPFEIVAAIKVYKPSEAEVFIHDRLSEYRVYGKKEFFKVELGRLKIAMNETAYNFRLPIIEDIEGQYNKAYDKLRQFLDYFKSMGNLLDYGNFFVYESQEFHDALDRYVTLSIMLPERVADAIRSKADSEKKSVDVYIREGLTAYIEDK